MKTNTEIKNGLYLVCNRDGQINDVLFDDLGLIKKNRLPVMFADIIDKESIKKATDFWKEIIENEFAFDVEMYVKREEKESVPLKFTAGSFNEQVWVIAASRSKVLEKMLNEMMLINNEQQNLIRSAEKKLSKFDDSSKNPPLDMYDELSQMNNDLMNAQRKLAKQNQEILRLNKQLRDSNKEFEHFAYSVSHDLKEPLRMVKSFMNRLDQKYGDSLDDKAKKYIYYAVDGAERMDQLINDLLEYSRIGKKNNEFELTDLNELLDKVEKLYRSQLEEIGGSISRPETEMPQIFCQKTPLQQLFNNLISNSIKYRKEEESLDIRISYEEKPNEWLFSVADNGKGIDPEYHSVIFNLFRKVDDDSTSGTGMGLAICKKIVEQHGGKIWVVSEKGKGSSFKFTIKKRL
ncbi:sensor histidine kinase [Rhodohalobacter sp.]|uniref:sensor histidine kinase n=1 Tax=Rhodohalobacter sp. TaxID=1974210 RepID=UPI002ACECFF2|nr:ATP-binding protein [Rhodohalobacter sp.]MDZ7755427.1 ATP-binding protein [Rhodohalobacter sp.]